MRVIGYVRESPGPDSGDTAYVQSERIRRWAAHNGYRLVSVCQDTRTGDTGASREGFGALLGVVAAGQADLVVLPSLMALSPDKVTQEVMLWELRRTGVGVASAEEDDLPFLSEPTADPARLFIRDTLLKVDRYRQAFGTMTPAEDATTDQALDDAEVDVVIEIVAAEAVEDLARRRALRQASA